MEGMRGAVRWLDKRRADVILLVAVTAVGAAVRASFVLAADFPLNDGGMFYVAVSDIKANSWRMPEALSYNHAAIPFAYPPLAFYLTRLFEAVTGAETLTSQRVLPLFFSAAAIPPFYILTRTFTARHTSFIASWIFALVPHGFDWEIGGGGLTRAPGLFFAFVAVACLAHVAFRRAPPAVAAGAGVATALAVLCHPQMGLFVVYTGAVFLAFAQGRPVVARRMGLAAAIAAAGVLPWLVFALSHVGISPFVAASQTGTHGPAMIQVLGPSFFSEPMFPIVAALGGVGLAWCAGTRSWLVPSWAAAIMVLDPRKAETLGAAPVAILGAFALVYVLLPALGGRAGSEFDSWSGAEAPGLRQRLGLYVVLGFILLGAILAPLLPTSPLHSLTPEVRETLRRIDREVSPEARFLVVTGDEHWALDALSEWFPALTKRASLGTVQGSEWLSGGEFRKRIDAYEELQDCADEEVDCLVEWAAEQGLAFDHVFVPRDVYSSYGTGDPEECCALLLSALDRSLGYELVLDAPGGRVYRRGQRQGGALSLDSGHWGKP
jgi:hypothetical protein